MINPLFNDAQLRNLAAEYVPGDSPLSVLADMADRLPWSALGTADFNEAHDRVMALIATDGSAS